jgi:hypothetical protein
MQVSVGDQIRVTAGFREGKNAFKNNDIAKVGRSVMYPGERKSVCARLDGMYQEF